MGRNPFGIRLCAVAATLIFLFTTIGHAQESQFLFDANGNLLVQTAATTAPPQIISQPQNRVVAPGDSASFFVVAADTRGITYQWWFNNANVGGATGDALLLQNLSTNNEGEYRVVLTNPSGSVTSAPALLMLDSDADGMGDSWELTFFGNLTNTATASFDGDGSSNLQEFLDGTNPTNSASVLFHLTVLLGGGSVAKTPDQSSYTNGQSVTLTVTASSNETFHAWIGDVATRSNTVTLVMTNNKTLFASFSPIIFTWTNLAGGDWDVAANWTPNLAPGSNDSVVISSGSSPTVTLNTPANCADVTLGSAASSPTLTGTGALTVRGNFLWVNGAMSGSGRTILEANATLSLNNPFSLSLTTRTLENGGTAVWSAGSISLGGVITNRAGALFHVLTAASISGGGRFDNAGTFRKSANAGTTAFTGVSLNNSGTVEIQTGSLNLGGNGTHSGSFAVSSGTTLNFSGGTHIANVSSSITGAGKLTVVGVVTSSGLVNVAGSNTFSSGVATFTGNTICTNNTLTISGGTATFNGTGVIAPAVLDLSDGSLDGSNVVTVLNQMNWTGGSMGGSGRTIIPPGVTLNAAVSGFPSLTTRTLENGGTVLWTGTATLNMSSGVITNRAGALFHVQSAVTFGFNGGSPRFDNAGTFRKSANTGTTTIGVNFTNYGTVDIRSGILAANSACAFSSNALLNCALGGTNVGTGYGRLQVAGTVTLNGGLSVDLLPGFTPATNDTFTVVTAGTRNGTFTSFVYPSNAVTMQLSNTPNSVIVRVNGLVVPDVVLFAPILSSSNVLLSWTAVSNKIYRLEFNPDLGLTNWDAIPGDVTTLSNRATKLDALTSSNRFYRVRVLP